MNLKTKQKSLRSSLLDNSLTNKHQTCLKPWMVKFVNFIAVFVFQSLSSRKIKLNKIENRFRAHSFVFIFVCIFFSNFSKEWGDQGMEHETISIMRMTSASSFFGVDMFSLVTATLLIRITIYNHENKGNYLVIIDTID